MPDQPQRDYLTGFSLRDSLYVFLKTLIADAKSNKRHFSILLIDLDRFKQYNDKFGHLFGDDVLEYVADIFRLFFPKESCFRYGGDEFIIVLADKTPKDAFHLASQIKHAMLKRPFFFEGKSYNAFNISFSCGIAGFPSDGRTVGELLKKADEAMYFSKRYGHNLTTIAGRMRYITFRNILFLFVSSAVIFAVISILYLFLFKGAVHEIIQKAGDIRITAGKEKFDTIILKSGGALKGKILKETEKELMLQMELETGTGSLLLQKSEIADIRRAGEVMMN